MYSQKNFAKPHLQYQLNISRTESLSSVGIMIFQREVQYYRCSLSAVSIGYDIFPNEFTNFQQYRIFLFPDQNYKDGPLKLLQYIFGIRDEVLGQCNPYLNQTDKISKYIFPTMKGLNLLWKHSPLLIKYLLSRNSYVYPIWIFTYHIDQA